MEELVGAADAAHQALDVELGEDQVQQIVREERDGRKLRLSIRVTIIEELLDLLERMLKSGGREDETRAATLLCLTVPAVALGCVPERGRVGWRVRRHDQDRQHPAREIPGTFWARSHTSAQSSCQEETCLILAPQQTLPSSSHPQERSAPTRLLDTFTRVALANHTHGAS